VRTANRKVCSIVPLLRRFRQFHRTPAPSRRDYGVRYQQRRAYIPDSCQRMMANASCMARLPTTRAAASTMRTNTGSRRRMSQSRSITFLFWVVVFVPGARSGTSRVDNAAAKRPAEGAPIPIKFSQNMPGTNAATAARFWGCPQATLALLCKCAAPPMRANKDQTSRRI
jgi:hypothetical protein